MTSFKERFKDKLSIVGKDGEHAMLAPQQQQQQHTHSPQTQPIRKAVLAKVESIPASRNAQSENPVGVPGTFVGVAPRLPPTVSPTVDAPVATKRQQQSTLPLSAAFTGVAGGVAKWIPPLPVSFGLFMGGGQQLQQQPPHLLAKQQQQQPSSVIASSSAASATVGMGNGVTNTNNNPASAPAMQQRPSFSIPLSFQPTGVLPASADSKQQAVGTYDYGSAAKNVASSEKDVLLKKAKKIIEVENTSKRKSHLDGEEIRKPKSIQSRPTRDVSSDARLRNNSNEQQQQQQQQQPSADPKRDVHYKPYTMDDYARMKEAIAKKTSGGLGPSDTDEQRAAAARLQRQREYAENIKKINRAIMHVVHPSNDDDELTPESSPRESRPIVQPPPAEVIERQQRRERAIQYSKQVPKPKLRLREDTSSASDGGLDNPGSDPHGGDLEAHTQVHAKERAIADMESRHVQDQLVVENIKKQLRI